MHAGSWESTREAFEWQNVNSSVSLASRVLYQILKWTHNSLEVQVKHGPMLLEPCHCHFIQTPSTQKRNFSDVDTVIVHTYTMKMMPKTQFFEALSRVDFVENDTVAYLCGRTPENGAFR